MRTAQQINDDAVIWQKKRFNGMLANRAANCLYAEGIRSKRGLIAAIKEKGFIYLKGIPNLGKISYRQIVIYSGLDEPSPKVKNLTELRAIAFLEKKGYKVTRDKGL